MSISNYFEIQKELHLFVTDRIIIDWYDNVIVGYYQLDHRQWVAVNTCYMNFQNHLKVVAIGPVDKMEKSSIESLSYKRGIMKVKNAFLLAKHPIELLLVENYGDIILEKGFIGQAGFSFARNIDKASFADKKFIDELSSVFKNHHF